MYNVCMKTLPHIQDLRRILVLRGDGFLADAIISSCCYRELKKANPNLKITVACFGPAYELFKNNSYVDRVVKLPVKALKEEKVTFEKVGRNDPCPCGSGKKYKDCCGK